MFAWPSDVSINLCVERPLEQTDSENTSEIILVKDLCKFVDELVC